MMSQIATEQKEWKTDLIIEMLTLIVSFITTINPTGTMNMSCLQVCYIFHAPTALINTDNGKNKSGIVGGGVQLGPHGTAATNRPIVPALGDYDDG
jgi:hypothetical protein